MYRNPLAFEDGLDVKVLRPIIGGISLKIHPEGGKHEGTLNGKSLFVKTRVILMVRESMILEMMAALLKCLARRSGLVIRVMTHW